MKRDLFEEMAALVRALRTMNDILNFGDRIYDVREREGMGWEGPQVKAYGDACASIQPYLKEGPKASEVSITAIPIHKNITGETCPKCGSLDFFVARDMASTRRCAKCQHTWAYGEGRQAGGK